MIPSKKAIHNYKAITLDAAVEYASPYELTKMLFSGALKSLTLVPMLYEKKDFELASKELSRSMAIINGLRDSLDLSQGELAENLYELYSYMIRTLGKSIKANDSSKVIEVKDLLSQIDEAWAAIPLEFRS